MPDFLRAIAALLWPVVIGGLLIALFPVVRRMLSESAAVNIEVGGTKVSIQRASDDLKHLISDLQDRVNELESHVEGDADVVAKPATESLPIRRLLWVDDRREANVYERARLEDAGVLVTQAASTSEALGLIHGRGPFDVIVSDMGRIEDAGHINRRAGLDLLERVRAAGQETPIIFYSSSRGLQSVADDLAKHPDVQATASPSELMRILAVSEATNSRP